MKRRLKSGSTGWMALALAVFAWDYGVGLKANGETLSGAFARASKHPISRWPVLLVWAITTAHLFEKLPKQVDPFHRATTTLGRGRTHARVVEGLSE